MRNIVWLALTASLEALQLVIVVALIFSFIPIPLDPFYSTIFAFFGKGLYQKRDMFYYRVLILTAIGLQALLVYKFKNYIENQMPLPKVRSWLGMAVLLLVPQFILIYEFWLGAHPQEARLALCGVCVLAVAARIFWPEIYGWACRRSPKGLELPSLFRPRRDLLLLGLLTSALALQAYLYALAVYGCLNHVPIWPEGGHWAYGLIAVVVLAVVISMVAAGLNMTWGSGLRRRDSTRTALEVLLSAFLVNAVVKMHFYSWQPQLAQRSYQVLLVLSVLIKIFWPWLERILQAVSGLVRDTRNGKAIRGMVSAAFVFFIFLFLYVPDLEAAIARVFMGEQFHGIDSCLMNAGWAYSSGCKLDLDVNNRYGLGMAVMTAGISGLLGGFTYLNVYTLVMFACILYFIMVFLLLRWWLASVPLAMGGTLIALKMQPFHEETSSFYLTTPSQTVCRYFFDMPFFALVLLFLRRPRKYLLAAAAGVCAVALFYEADTGVYLTCAFYAFLIILYSFKPMRDKIYSRPKDLVLAALLVLIPPAGSVLLLLVTQGVGVLTPKFWQNMLEYAHAQMWYGPVHLWEALRIGDWWLFGMAMGVIAAYLLTMLIAGTLVYLRKRKPEWIFVIVLCVYGLALQHYYINRSTLTTSYKVIIPYVFILCFWLREFAGRLTASRYRKVILCFLALCFYGLWTTHLTLAYPNVFNFSRNPATDPLVAVKQSQGKLPYFNFLFSEYPDAFKLPLNNLGEVSEEWRTEDDFRSDEQLKDYFRKEFNFSQDAALIDSLTSAGEPVALISSFEIEMLIEAKRKPFFYIFPLVNSRPMRMRLFEVTHMWTTTQAMDTIRQLEDAQPPYVFMERVYLSKVISAAYLYDMPAVCALDKYVLLHYEPYAYGKYLVAMKLKKGQAT